MTKSYLFLIIFLGIIIYFYYIFKKRINVYDEDFIKRTTKDILEVNRTSIRIHKVGSKISPEYFWKDITSTELINNELHFALKKEKSLIIKKSEFPNYWRILLLSIPETIAPENVKIITNKLKENLKTCDVCGKIAKIDNDCLNCSAFIPMDRMVIEAHELKTQEDIDTYYKKQLKNEQLFWFSVENSDDKVDFYEKCDIFKTDNNWKPIVSEKEVREWSKDFYED